VERRRGVGLFVNRVRTDSRERIRKEMLAEAFGKAAALAVQMGIPESEASRLFSEQLRRMRSPGKGRNDDA
jgi:hypothetical protein